MPLRRWIGQSSILIILAIRSTLKPGFARSELTTSCNYFHFGDTFLTSTLSQKCGFSSAF